MKVKIAIVAFIVSFQAIAHESGEMVKCQGYVDRGNEDRTYYELQGKILKVLGRHYMIYGYTPVFKSKRLHKVLKISCVRPDENFIEEVTEVKEELVEQAPIEVQKSPGIKIDEEVEVAKEFTEKNTPASEDEIYEDFKEEFNKVPDKTVDYEEEFPESSHQPINSRPKTVSKNKSNDESSENQKPSSDDGSCDKLSKKGITTIIKCFVKDGYGSL